MTVKEIADRVAPLLIGKSRDERRRIIGDQCADGRGTWNVDLMRAVGSELARRSASAKKAKQKGVQGTLFEEE